MQPTITTYEKDGMTWTKKKYEDGFAVETAEDPNIEPPSTQPQKPTTEQVQAQQLLELQKLNRKSDMINKALSTVLLGMQKGGR